MCVLMYLRTYVLLLFLIFRNENPLTQYESKIIEIKRGTVSFGMHTFESV